MLAKVKSFALIGLDGVPVEVEADINKGMTSYELVGLPDAAVKESRERINSAIRNSRLHFPVNRVTINLAPADIKKEGSYYDLPIALAILRAGGQIEGEMDDIVILGELALDGSVRPVSGILPALISAKKHGFTNPSVIVVGKVCQLHDELNWFEQRPLFGRRIVVTRAREQASGLAARLQELGAEVIEFPTIRIDPLSDESRLDQAVAELASYQWVIFTSVNGVRFFWKALRGQGRDARALASCRLVAIGPATASALEAHGLHADLVPEKYVAEGVVEALRKQGPLDKARFLLPRAARAREVLPEALREAHAVVDVVPCYETVPEEAPRQEVLDRILAGEVDCVTFGSSSTVENFLSLVPAAVMKEHPSVLLAAIGPVTAQTLAQHGLAAQIQPENYTIPHLVDALIAHYGK